MEQAAGYINIDNPTAVSKLNRVIYGLKQAPRAWFDKLKGSLISLGFKQSVSDTSIFFLQKW